MKNDEILVEIGYGLIYLLDKKKGAPLLEGIAELRKKIPQLPVVRIVDKLELAPLQFSVAGKKVSMSDNEDFCSKILENISIYSDRILKIHII